MRAILRRIIYPPAAVPLAVATLLALFLPFGPPLPVMLAIVAVAAAMVVLSILAAYSWHEEDRAQFARIDRERHNDLIEKAYLLIDSLQALVTAPQVLSERLKAKSEAKEETTEDEQMAFIRSRWECESAYGSQYRTRVFLIMQRFKEAGILPDHATREMKVRGRWEDIVIIKDDLAIMVHKLDQASYD